MELPGITEFSLLMHICCAAVSKRKRLLADDGDEDPVKSKIAEFRVLNVEEQEAVRMLSKIDDECYTALKQEYKRTVSESAFRQNAPENAAQCDKNDDEGPPEDMPPSLPSDRIAHRRLYDHFKSTYNNGKVYDLAKEGKLEKAVDLLLGTPFQENHMSVVYKMPFGNSGEMHNFGKCLASYDSILRAHNNDSFSDFHAVYNRVAETLEKIENEESRDYILLRKGHYHYYHKYKQFVAARCGSSGIGGNQRDSESALAGDSGSALAEGSESALMDYFLELQKRFTKTAKITEFKRQIYNLLLLEAFRANAVTGRIIIGVVIPYISLRCHVATFELLCAILSYANSDKGDCHYGDGHYEKAIRDEIEKMLLGPDFMEGRSIYDILKFHRVCDRLSIGAFSCFTELVYARILKIESEEERSTVLDLYKHVVPRVLEGIFQRAKDCNMLIYLNKIKISCIHLHDAISGAELRYVGVLLENDPACQHIAQVLCHLCTVGALNILQNALCGMALSSEQIASLLRAVLNAPNCEKHAMVQILYEIVRCRAIKDCHSRYLLESSRKDHSLAISYALALMTNIHKCSAANGNPELKRSIILEYSLVRQHFDYLFCLSTPDFMNAPLSNTARGYYLLHAFDMSLQETLLGSSPVTLGCRFGFYSSLLKSLDSLADKLASAIPFYEDLRALKIRVFRLLRSYAQNNGCTRFLATIVEDLLEAKVPLPDVFKVYFENAKEHKLYLFKKYLVHVSEAKGAANALLKNKYSPSPSYIQNILTNKLEAVKNIEKESRGKFNKTALKKIASELSNLLFKNDNMIKDLETNSELGAIFDALILEIADVCFRNMFSAEKASNADFSDADAFYLLFAVD